MFAAGEGPPRRGIPYQGYLELDGAPLSTSVPMSFSLWDDEVAGTEVWGADDVPVTPAGGQFAVILGDGAGPALPDAVFVASELYLAVEVDGVPLGNRTRIHAAPQANRAELARRLVLTPIGPVATVETTADHGIAMFVDTDNNADSALPAFRVLADGSLDDVSAPTILHLNQAGSLDVNGVVTDSASVAGHVAADSLGVAGHTTTNSLNVNGNDHSFSFGGDHSDQGYVRIGALQIEWGPLVYNVTSQSTYADFAMALPWAAPPRVSVTLQDPGFGVSYPNDGVGVTNISTTQFSVLHKQHTFAPHTAVAHYVLIGRWK